MRTFFYVHSFLPKIKIKFNTLQRGVLLPIKMLESSASEKTCLPENPFFSGV